MFWSEILIQRTLFGEDEYQSSSCVAQLIEFAKEAFPEMDGNFHRYVAFLTHRETQQFLSPMLVRRYGNLDAAKQPTMDWLDGLGSLETFSRSTRKSDSDTKPANIKPREMPAWYVKYCDTDRCTEMKSRAANHWQVVMGEVTCMSNARHPYEVMHHRDYGRLGESDEFRYMVPLCNRCHVGITAWGPNVQKAMPSGVGQWL